MPSKNSGKTITKIKINKKNVVLYFGKTRMEISPDAYATTYLYVGKVLTNKDISNLKSFSAIAELMKYALSLLKKGHYSEWRMREKLYAKEASKKDVDKIIGRLKANDLINDKMLIEDLIAYGDERSIGKNKILKELSAKGIFEENLSKIKFPYSKEKKKAMCQLPKLERKYASYSYENKKQHIYNGLVSLGFESIVIEEVINKISPIDEKDEKNKINKDFDKIYERLSKKYEGKQLKDKVFMSLKNKGYRYGDIYKKWEAKQNDDWRVC